MDEKLTKHGIKTFLTPINWIIVTGLVFFISAGALEKICNQKYVSIYSLTGFQ